MTDPYRQIIRDNLAFYGTQPSEALEPAKIALELAALNHAGISIERYNNNLLRMAEDVGKRYGELVAAGADETVETKLASLKHIFTDQYGFEAVTGTAGQQVSIFDADLMEVIDRRAGMPILLAFLCLFAARQQGWEANILDIPGHYILRLDDGGTRLIFDPTAQCRVLQAADLRKLVKMILGEAAELSISYYEPVDNRTLLVQLQNIIKILHIQNEEYDDALEVVETLLLLAPDEYRLLLDAGLLYARGAEREKAVRFLEAYIEKAPDPRDRHEAALLIQQINEVQ